MMRKKIVSLCMALVLCLGLLPVTALAVGEPATLYVGNKQVISSTETTYWTTDASGTLTQSNEKGTWNVKYDPGTATLTLNEAKISGSYNEYNNPFTAGIYAKGSSNQSVALTIELIGTNTITGCYGIYLDGHQGNTICTNASVLIKNGNDSGESGSLTVNGTSNHGIYIISGTGNASLTIENASVVANATSSYGGSGVCVQSGASSKDSPKLSLAVNGGSLTASSGTDRDGIEFYVGALEATSATTSLTVTDNAIVDARNGGISASGVSGNPNVTIGSTGSTGGIVWNGSEGTVYGSVELQKNLTIGEGESLTIPDGASLTIGNDATLINEGTVTNNGTLTNNGKIENSGTLPSTIGGTAPPSITTNSLADGAENTAYTATLAADGEPASWTWSADANSSLPPGLTLSGNSISGTPTTTGTYYFTVTATNSGGSDSEQLSITIAVPVESVSLDKTTLGLTKGETAQLTATVLPETATNRNVTWSSNAPGVATVDSSGKVTAVAPGTATITVTTEDGKKTATCTVTVRPDIPPANPNYRITVEATQGGTVTADPAAAKAGTTVTLTPVPDRGYQVGTVAVTDRFGDAVAVTEQAGGTYTFTMPSGQVKVEVTFVEVQPEPLPFTDVNEGDWFHDAVRYVYDNGLMDGVGDGQFAPNATTNRAMVVTILYRLAGEPDVSGDVAFTDVEPGLWYTDAVLWAAEKGIVNGISETEFAPAGDLTREQLATVLYRYAEGMGYDVSASVDLSGFPDAGDIQDYAMEALSWAVAEGLLQGFEDDSLQPGGTATRAQIATILMRFLSAAPTA